MLGFTIYFGSKFSNEFNFDFSFVIYHLKQREIKSNCFNNNNKKRLIVISITLCYSDAASTLGALTGWSDEQLVKLKDAAVLVYGLVNTWSAATLMEANAAVG